MPSGGSPCTVATHAIRQSRAFERLEVSPTSPRPGVIVGGGCAGSASGRPIGNRMPPSRVGISSRSARAVGTVGCDAAGVRERPGCDGSGDRTQRSAVSGAVPATPDKGVNVRCGRCVTSTWRGDSPPWWVSWWCCGRFSGMIEWIHRSCGSSLEPRIRRGRDRVRARIRCCAGDVHKGEAVRPHNPEAAGSNPARPTNLGIPCCVMTLARDSSPRPRHKTLQRVEQRSTRQAPDPAGQALVRFGL